MGKHVVLVVKNPLTNMGDAIDAGSIPGLGRRPGGGNGNSLQWSCMKTSWTEEPEGLWGPKKLDTTEQMSTCAHTRKQSWFHEANLGFPLPCNSQSKLARLPPSTLQSFPSPTSPRGPGQPGKGAQGEDGPARVRDRRCVPLALLSPFFNASSIFFLSSQDT